MIFLDANFLIRYLTPPETPEEAAMTTTASSLFDAIDRGEENATTSEVVLHEVASILSSKKHFSLSTSEVVSYLNDLLQIPGLKLPRGDKKVYLRALEIYSANPNLEFADSIIAARAEHLGVPLATFEERLGKLPSITRWQPNIP